MAFSDMTSQIAFATYEALSLVWMEVAMFAAAAIVYLFCVGLPHQSKKGKGSFDSKSDPKPTNQSKDLQQRREAKELLRKWQEVKTAVVQAPNPSELYNIVDAMRQLGKLPNEVCSELRTAVTANPDLEAAVVALPTALLRDDAMEMLSGILDLLQEFGKPADVGMYSGLMAAQLRRRDFAGVKATAAKISGDAFTSRMHAILACALAHLGVLQEAMEHMTQLPDLEEGGRSLLPATAGAQVLSLAARHGKLDVIVKELLRLGVRLEPKHFNEVVLAEGRKGGVQLCKELMDAAEALDIPKGPVAYQALAEALGAAKDTQGLTSLVNLLDGLRTQVPVQEALACALLEACMSVGPEGSSLVSSIVGMHRISSAGGAVRMKVLSVACKILLTHSTASEVCDFFEREMMALMLKKGGSWPEVDLTEALLKVATDEGRDELMTSLCDHSNALERSQAAPASSAAASSQSNNDPYLQRSVASIKALAKERDLAGATAVFERLRGSGMAMRPQVYNCFLDACVQCNDIAGALKLFEEMKKLCFVDVVSYNTILKAYLSCGRFQDARNLVQEMSTRGVQANKVTYNELLNAKVVAKDRAGMWNIVEEMVRAGVRASFITCSILLKSLTTTSTPSEVKRVMDLIDTVDEPVDEVLFSSIIEACIRLKKLNLLSDFIRRYRQKGIFFNIHAPTYGTMIKAYGEAGDVAQVKDLWNEMQTNNVKPTAITIGCMVEALVINHQGDEAWDLVQKELQVEERKGLINTVVYSTVLKGFAVAKRIDKVFMVYKEMRANGIACNTITYNTMLDACAKCCVMDRASSMLEDMRESCIEPDIITYSTILKGYCLSGDVDRAFHVLEEMKRDGKFAPDEIMYNSILDGCAKQRRVDDALRMLEEMKAAGIKPTNYTLSILVKLLGHARRLSMALQMVDDISQQNNFRPNIQVYTCLVHACFQNKRLERALAVHESALAEGCYVDDKFYAVLARGCLQMRHPAKVVEVIRTAYRLAGSSLTSPPKVVGVDAATLAEILSKMAGGSEDEQAAAAQLRADLHEHGIRVNGSGYNRRVNTGTVGGPSRERKRLNK